MSLHERLSRVASWGEQAESALDHFRRTTAILTAQGLGIALRLLTFIVIGRLRGTGAVGLIASVIAVATLVSLLAGMGLKNAAIRFIASGDAATDEAAAGFLANAHKRIAQVALALLCIGGPLIVLALDGSSRTVCLLGFFLGTALAFFNLQVEVLRARGFPLCATGLAQVGYPLVTFLLVCASLSFGSAWIAPAASFGGAAWLFVLLIPYGSPKLRRSALPRFHADPLVRFGAPLIVSNFSQMMLAQLPVLLLTWLAGEAESGGYAIAYRLSALPALLTAAVNASYAPAIAHDLSSGDGERIALATRNYRKVLLVNSGLVAITLIVLLPSSRVLLQLYGTGFVEHRQALVLLLLGLAVSAAVGPVAFTLISLGHNIAVSASYFAAGASTIVAMLLWSDSSESAAVCVMTGMAFQTVAQAVLLWRRWPVLSSPVEANPAVAR